MSNQIKVSIIVPVYNVEKYLERCLNSLINQTLKEIEIICINDGSKDNSLKILERYSQKDNRIIIIDKKNEGQSIARNIGIEKASGEYIGFVDSDDWIDLNYYKSLYNSVKKFNADIGVTGIIRLHKFNKKVHLKIEKEYTTEDFAEKLELCDIPDLSYAWNKIYKLEKIKKYNLKFKEGIIYEDVIFTPEVIFKLGKLVTVPKINYYYWRNTNSTVTQRSEKAKQDSFWAHKWAEDFFKEHNIDIEKYSTKTKRYKLLGFSIFKIRTKNNKTTYSLFNIIKWQA